MITVGCCRGLDPIGDTERLFECSPVVSRSRCCRGLDPIGDTERVIGGNGDGRNGDVAEGSIRLGILKDGNH